MIEPVFHVWSVHVTLLELWEEFYWSAQELCVLLRVEHGKVTKQQQQQHSNALQTGKVVKNAALLAPANTVCSRSTYLLTTEFRHN